jgi:hypothetical protein
MILLNFSHPITPAQAAQIEALTGQSIARTIEAQAQFDVNQPFVAQVEVMVSGLPLTPTDWQSAAILVVPPALNFITGVLLAEMHGRMGYLPTIVRIRPQAGATPPVYEVAEIINLQAVRETARLRRQTNQSGESE